MQQVQEQLDFPIDIPSNGTLYEHFHELEEQLATRDIEYAKKLPKKRNRKSNKQKRLDRLNREV